MHEKIPSNANLNDFKNLRIIAFTSQDQMNREFPFAFQTFHFIFFMLHDHSQASEENHVVREIKFHDSNRVHTH